MTDDEIKAIRTIYDRGYTVTAANDIPNLIDEIVRLRAENTRLRADLAKLRESTTVLAVTVGGPSAFATTREKP